MSFGAWQYQDLYRRASPTMTTPGSPWDAAERVAKRARSFMGAPASTTLGGLSAVGGECSQSFWVHNRKVNEHAARGVDNWDGPTIKQLDYGGCFTSNIGRQGNWEVGYAMNFNDFNEVLDLYKDYILELDRPEAPESTRIAYEDAKIYVRDIDMQIEICNQGNTLMWFSLYDLVKSTTDRLNNFTNRATVYTPVAVWTEGVNQQRAKQGARNQTLEPVYVGAVPTDSSRFGQEWHIHETTRVCLPPGGIHVHHVRFGANFILPINRFVRSDNSESSWLAINDYVAGLSYCCMISQHGAPSPTVDGLSASYQKSDLCIIWHKRLKTSFGVEEQKVRDGETSLSVGPLAPNIVVPQTGVITPYADAVP